MNLTIDTKSAANLRPPKQLKLPFSSPITDEASSPENSSLASDSSGSGHRPNPRMVGRISGIEAGTSLSKNNFERALYTDLAKPKEQQETMQWSSSNASPTSNHTSKQSGKRKSGISKKSQRPTGLQVVTNFSRNQSVSKGRNGDIGSDQVGRDGQPLLDLQGLKQIILSREKQRMRAKQEQRAPRSRVHNDQKGAGNYASPQSLEPGSAPISGLSPSDGSVVIGLGMPYDNNSTNGRKENTARGLAVQNLQAPPTPSILVTPAKEESSWPSDSPDLEIHRPRVASSVYSQPTPRVLDEDIPPVPAIPDLHSIVRNKDAKRILTAQNTPTMRSERPMSADTVFEDDSPRERYVTQHTPTMASVLSPSLSDTNRHQSQGWWTYLLSPLLKRSSTISTRRTGFSPRSIPPQSATSFTFKDSTRGLSEKETSHFSPETPETGGYERTDIWSSLEKQGIEELQRGPAPPAHDIMTRNVFPDENVEPNLVGHGLAAEYYQASAHDLWNEEPYFECVGHICSMTTQKRCAEIIKQLQDSENERDEKSTVDTMPASFAILDLLAKMHDPLMAELEKQKAAEESKKSVEDPFSDGNEKALPTENTRDLISLDDGEASTRDASVAPIARSARSPSPPPVDEREPVQEPPRTMPPREPTPVPMPAPMPAPSPTPPVQMAPAPIAPATQPMQMPQMPPQMPPPVMQPMVVYPAPMPAQVPPPSIPPQPMFQEPVHQLPQSRTMSPVQRMPSPEEIITNNMREQAPGGLRPPGMSSQQQAPRAMSPVVRMPSPEENLTNSTREQSPSGLHPRGLTPQETAPRTMSPVVRMPSPEDNLRNYTREQAPSGLALQGMLQREANPQETTSREMAPRGITSRERSSSPEITTAQDREIAREERIQPPVSIPTPPRRPSPAAVRTGSTTPPLQSSRGNYEDDSDREPPPYYTPPTSRSSSRLRSNYLQVGNTRPQRPVSPDPVSPGMQRAMTSRGGIPMSEVRSFQDERDTQRGSVNGGQIQDQHHGTFTTVGTIRHAENNTRSGRLQKENSFWKRATGCMSRKNEKGRDRRWYCAIVVFCIIVILLSVILAICLTHKGDPTPVQSQWLNLTGYPPMPTGVMTVAGPDPAVERSSCVSPTQMWTCALPKEQQDSNTGYASDRPNFRFEISFHNGSYPNSTTVRSSMTNSRRSLFERDDAAPSPTPAVPRLADQKFLGNTTDNVTAPFEGEETPFFITFLSPVDTSDYTSQQKRDFYDNGTSTTLAPSTTTTKSSSPSKTTGAASSATTSSTGALANIENLIPAPAMASDGTASAATLYPLPGSQPIKLYDRGKPTEHYGFYTYFDKSIFLESKVAVTGDNNLKDSDSEDSNGGSTKNKANVRCTWSQTRFLVRIWTQPSNITHMSITASSSSNSTNNATATTTASATTSLSTISPTSTSSSSANNFTSPGSFPYPITLTVDRHGGLATEKLIYCYSLEQEGYYNLTSPKLEDEDRSSGGSIIQPSPGYVALAEAVQQGIKENQTEPVDGGTGGCECEWRNWISFS